MEKNGVTPDDKDSSGMPALHVAMLNDQLKFADWLLVEAKANIDGTENTNLYTALHLMIKEEKWDAVMWLLERGADWDAQAQRAGETPMELVQASGNNRFFLKFKDACDAMKGKRVRDKIEASRPKPKAEPLPPVSAASSSSSYSSASTTQQPRAAPAAAPAAAAPAAGASGNSEFTSSTVALVKAVKQFKITCENGDAAGADAESAAMQQLCVAYKPMLERNIAATPPQAIARVQESQQVLAKGLGALSNVGKAVANDPSNQQAVAKLAQVSELVDKHFKRIVAICIKKQLDYQG
jgi:ankyrin repeat protein